MCPSCSCIYVACRKALIRRGGVWNDRRGFFTYSFRIKKLNEERSFCDEENKTIPLEE